MIDLIQRYNGNSSREKEDVGEDTQRKMTRTSMFKTRYQQSLKLAASEFSNETTVWYNFECLEIRINVVLFWWNTKGTYYLQKHSTEPRSCMLFYLHEFSWNVNDITQFLFSHSFFRRYCLLSYTLNLVSNSLESAVFSDDSFLLWQIKFEKDIGQEIWILLTNPCKNRGTHHTNCIKKMY